MKRTPSIRNVNLLYTVTFLALLVGSALLPALSLGWRVVINELVFLGLPLGVFLLLARPGLRESLGLRGVSWEVAALSLLVGLGLWRFDSWLAVAVNSFVGYTIPLPPEALNVTTSDKVAMAVGTVVLAPLVEEFLFRGAIQSAYERHGPVRAIAASTFLFVMIHQELAQSVALGPVALALGYVTWRTRSILPAMLVHLGNNAQAMLISAFQTARPHAMTFTPSPIGALIGGLIGVVALWLIGRLSARPSRAREAPQRGWLARNWPILPAVPIYLAVIALGVLFGVRPELLALGQSFELTSAPWEAETGWDYEILNALDEPVGEAECSLILESAAYVLDCSMEQSAYEADAPFGFFKEGDVTQRHTVRWDRESLALDGAQIAAAFTDGPDQSTLEAQVESGQLSVRIDGAAGQPKQFAACYDIGRTAGAEGSPPIQEPCQVDGHLLAGGGVFSPLMVGEWPWRLSALPFQLLYSRQTSLLWPYRSLEDVDGRAPVSREAFVVVRTAEQISTTAGQFVTWRVTVGEKYTAWYAVEAPHHLVAYSDGMVTWELTNVD